MSTIVNFKKKKHLNKLFKKFSLLKSLTDASGKGCEYTVYFEPVDARVNIITAIGMNFQLNELIRLAIFVLQNH